MIKIKFDLLQNSKETQKDDGGKDQEKETKEHEIQIKVKHMNGLQISI